MASLAVDENICNKDAFSRNQSGDSDYKVTDACNQQSDSSASRSNTRSPASTALVSESLAKRKIGLDTTDYTVITEGKAELLFTKGTKNFLNVDVTASPAFNQVRAFGRDFTIAVIKQFSWKNFERKKAQSYTSDNDFVPGEYWEDGITIFGGHSASGLRSIRYALEVPGIRQVLLNDSSDVGRETVDDIRLNVRHNSVEHLVQYSQSDPRSVVCHFHRYSSIVW
ncbi:PREDICTED: tRNA (guanine(26)-N(2))-dimethyltransferase-like [Priapulus caudatus]|uniref:tRNA (guanine(26)-N(2))-dimethyltransferase n=1 Tax=Priapulus caudatus TaxID=37621 RepID=A0ABM1EFQ8_PRICU|nr:PREDICTED: tRNA (guanine(26)-N(2))-dimethyltransferase-like [Priapulus caudatus]